MPLTEYTGKVIFSFEKEDRYKGTVTQCTFIHGHITVQFGNLGPDWGQAEISVHLHQKKSGKFVGEAVHTLHFVKQGRDATENSVAKTELEWQIDGENASLEGVWLYDDDDEPWDVYFDLEKVPKLCTEQAFPKKR